MLLLVNEVVSSSVILFSLQMILYDTPGVIEKRMHKLDSMMMKNVRSATINADCVLIVVDACKVPQKVFFFLQRLFRLCIWDFVKLISFMSRLTMCWKKV